MNASLTKGFSPNVVGVSLGPGVDGGENGSRSSLSLLGVTFGPSSTVAWTSRSIR